MHILKGPDRPDIGICGETAGSMTRLPSGNHKQSGITRKS